MKRVKVIECGYFNRITYLEFPDDYVVECKTTSEILEEGTFNSEHCDYENTDVQIEEVNAS